MELPKHSVLPAMKCRRKLEMKGTSASKIVDAFEYQLFSIGASSITPLPSEMTTQDSIGDVVRTAKCPDAVEERVVSEWYGNWMTMIGYAATISVAAAGRRRRQ